MEAFTGGTEEQMEAEEERNSLDLVHEQDRQELWNWNRWWTFRCLEAKINLVMLA